MTLGLSPATRVASIAEHWPQDEAQARRLDAENALTPDAEATTTRTFGTWTLTAETTYAEDTTWDRRPRHQLHQQTNTADTD